MIELNLTYEESKKILELGYDFSKICVGWSTEHTKYIKVGNKLIEPRLVEELELAHNQELHPHNFLWNYSLEFSEVESKIQDFINPCAIDWIIYSPPIPIIPKAALEACLPEFDNGFYFSKLHISQDKIVKRNHKDQWVLPYVSSTAFEAFTWCHENYPKELKKKFEEVMK